MKKTALITGASSGFGTEFARLFAGDGVDLVLVARNLDKLQSIASELGSKYNVTVHVFGKDLGRMSEVQNLYDEIISKNIQIDYLINNAGFGAFGEFHLSGWSRMEEMIDLNIKALTKLNYLFANTMISNGSGRIMNVASTAAFQPGPLMAVYFATKAFVLYLGEAMSNELKGTGVTVTTLCPGESETGFQAAAGMLDSKLFKGKKLPSAKEVAEFGYGKMMKGKMTVVHGLKNKIVSRTAGFLPRKTALGIVRKMLEKV